MPKKYTVIWSKVAEKDLASIIEYIAEESVDRALDILADIKKKVDNLYKFPSRGRIIPELLLHNIDINREIILSPWRIMYRIETNEVIILAVFDGRRNIEDVILERVLKM